MFTLRWTLNSNFVCVCRLHINAYVSALAMIKEKVMKSIASELTSWFALWSDDRKYHCIAGESCIHLKAAHSSPVWQSYSTTICIAAAYGKMVARFFTRGRLSTQR